MDIKILPDDVKSSLFDSHANHPLQSYAWGEARKKMGIKVVRVGEYQSDKLINVYQLTLHPLIFNLNIGYLPRSVMPSKAVIKFLLNWGKNNNVVFIKFEPYIEKQLGEKQIKQFNNMVVSNHPLFPSWTQVLDLSMSEVDMMKHFHHKTRYNIRLAEKKGVVVKEMTNQVGFKIFSQLYFDTCKRQKYFGHTEKYHQIVFDTLKNSQSHILIAFYNQIPLAAYHLFHYQDILYYVYGGTSDQYRNLMASNLLMWESIKLGKTLKAKTFDMWGSLPPDYSPTHSWSGFTRFKQGYGTKFVEMIVSYDLIINTILYSLYNIANYLRNIYLKLKI